MYIIGLTGGSGSGKSTVSNVLRDFGALIIDCDELAHKNMAKGGTAYEDIVDTFGKNILKADGEIERAILGDIVFNDKFQLEKLNKIAHFRVKQAAEEIIKSSCCKVGVIDAPQLIEADMQSMADEIWYIYADKSVRMARIMGRDNISEEKALARISNETPEKELKKYVTLTIEHNDDDLEKFRSEIIELVNNKGLFND